MYHNWRGAHLEGGGRASGERLGGRGGGGGALISIPIWYFVSQVHQAKLRHMLFHALYLRFPRFPDHPTIGLLGPCTIGIFQRGLHESYLSGLLVGDRCQVCGLMDIMSTMSLPLRDKVVG